jgi:polar amino acid transport system substrate-binding protein
MMKIMAGIAGAALLLSGCGTKVEDDTTPADPDAITTVVDGKLTMCSDIPFPPFEVEDSAAPLGYSGFDVDLMNAIAGILELELVVVVSDFDALQSGVTLANGQCDLAASAMTITEKRKENIDFSDAYYDSLQSLMVPANSEITSIADLAGKRVGVQAGTTGENYTEENAPEGADIVSFPDDGVMWPAIQAGQIDAILQDYPVNNQHVKDDAGYKIVERYETDEQYGFAMLKGGNPALLAAINSALGELRANGTYQEIYDRYFG